MDIYVEEDYQNANYEESEQGQLHAIHLHMNAVAVIQRKLGYGPSLSHCMECGEPIPLKRQQVIKGCKYCVDCQTSFE